MKPEQDLEKLGSFYLGRTVDPVTSETTGQPLLYDARDLTTHAVCVGMTGSGKTGLCVTLLEEAALDGIPAIAIDPKGDLGNLLLTFPGLSEAEFAPWIDPAAAARHGRTPSQEARATAELWSRGLAEWGQDGARIARLRAAVDTAIYTPGSQAGLPLAVDRSFDAPAPELARDADALRERVLGAVSGVLGLAGLDADPVRSREHILLAAVLERAWSEGRSLDLGGLVRAVQSPPFERLGVLDLESFFPARERFALAMTLNNLLASPAFAAWREGEPLDVSRLLYAEDGRPRLSILSIAHLSDSQRMFFVTLLLNEVVAWMRTQPGTSSLRALLYMDEVFGYFPPTANPPSKMPMLTLLKQARAHGLGVVLATQNPVDLDYKGLSNAGTWFLGRLQTERDKARVIEGLEGASTANGRLDRSQLERSLSRLQSRVFLMNNVHEDEPVLFHTRWALSYLRGPLTRDQIASLMASRPAREPEPEVQPDAPRPDRESDRPASDRPVVPPEIEERFLPVTREGQGRLRYRAGLLGRASLHYTRRGTDLDHWERLALLAPLEDEASPLWRAARVYEAGAPELDSEPEAGARFVEPPSHALQPRRHAGHSRALKSHLYRNRRLQLWRSKDPKAVSRPGEREAEFRAQLRQLLHERRDLELEKLRKRYAPKLQRLEERIRKAEQRVDREQAQYKERKLSTALSLGATLLSAVLGRKLGSAGNVGRASTAARRAGSLGRERGDVVRATEDVVTLRQRVKELEQEFQERLEAVREKTQASTLAPEALEIPPRKADLVVESVFLVWIPCWVGADGRVAPAA
jgi:DNA helicase HerA-like ATPase